MCRLGRVLTNRVLSLPLKPHILLARTSKEHVKTFRVWALSLHGVEPGGAGRSKVQVEAFSARQPTSNLLGFVSTGVVQDQVNVQIGMDRLID